MMGRGVAALGLMGAIAAGGAVAMSALASASATSPPSEPTAATGPSMVTGGAPAAPVTSALTASQEANVPYGAGFTFVRLAYEVGLGAFGGFQRNPGWAHDYPIAERNLALMIGEMTLIDPYTGGSNIFTTDNPALYQYPIAYMSEPGDWRPSEEEVQGLRAWLLKGGFLIFDDFGGRDWFQFEESMKRVLPEHEIHPLDTSHPVFDSFFRIESLDFDEGASVTGGRGRTRGRGGYRGTPEYYGITENNEPGGRLMVVVNYNNDIGDMWEWSDYGFNPVSLTNDAYQLGVNYIVYAMTH